jgi:hypothetical protein
MFAGSVQSVPGAPQVPLRGRQPAAPRRRRTGQGISGRRGLLPAAATLRSGPPSATRDCRGAAIVAAVSAAILPTVGGNLPTVHRYAKERASFDRHANSTDSASSPWSLPNHGEQNLLLRCLVLPRSDAVASLVPRFDRSSNLASGVPPSFPTETHEPAWGASRRSLARTGRGTFQCRRPTRASRSDGGPQ